MCASSCLQNLIAAAKLYVYTILNLVTNRCVPQCAILVTSQLILEGCPQY